MPARTVYYSFSTGLVSEEFARRANVSRQAAALVSGQNYVIKTTGAAARRDGTLFVSTLPGSAIRFHDFTFSREQSYTLAFGEAYVRIFRDLSPIEVSPGVPVSVATPYGADDLQDLQFNQTADVLFIHHADYPPAELFRVTNTDWRYRATPLVPPPSTEIEDVLGGALTTTGTTDIITATTTGQPFLQADVGRQIIIFEGGFATITDLVPTGSKSSQSVTAFVVDPLQATSFADGAWALAGSPVARLRVSDGAPIGRFVTATLELADDDAQNLLPAPNTWTDLSGPLLASGTHNGGNDVAELIDTTADFFAAGVVQNHLGENLDKAPGVILTVGIVAQTQITWAPPPAQNWFNGDNYRVFGTGTSVVSATGFSLSGGIVGTGWREAAMTTVDGDRYQVTFRVRGANVALVVGTTSGADDILIEATYIPNVGTELYNVTFVASGTTAYVGFKNNQDTTTTVDQIKGVQIDAFGFRQTDVGKFITGADGSMNLLVYVDPSQMQGIIYQEMTETDDGDVLIPAGSWTLDTAVWSDTRGWPQAGTFHQGRKWYAGSRSNPLALAGSRTGRFSNFAQGADPNAALFYVLSGEQMNLVQWLDSFHDLVVGTQGSEHFVTSVQASLTPEDRIQIPLGQEGVALRQPIRVANSLFVLQYGGRNILEMQFSDEGGLLDTVNLMILNERITNGGIVDWTYQRQPLRVAWMVRDDGLVIGLTVDMAEQVRAFHLHDYSGNVKTVSRASLGRDAIPETERLWIGVERDGVLCAEVHRPRIERTNELIEQLTVDAAVQYRGVATDTITGLSHLEGKTVRAVKRSQVTLDGVTRDQLANLGTYVVAGGQITLPSAHDQVDVGLDMPLPFIEPVMPSLPLQDGTMEGRLHHWARMQLRVMDSLGILVNGVQAPIRTPEDQMDRGMVPRSQVIDVDVKGWERDSQLTVAQELPFPSTILNLIGDVEWENVS